MKTNSELLQQYVEAGGNCVNLGRHLKVAHAELYTWILESTRFLDVKPKVKDTERIFCIQNNITALLLNKDGTFARFINLFSGYCIKKPQTPKPAKITRTKVVKTKIEKFVERSRHRNPHLYVEAAIEGIDYIVCPVSGARMAMIKRNYITNVLGMTVDEYDLLYPGVRRVSLSRQQNIKAGLKQIDPDIGLSKYEAGQVKARAKLKEADSAGKSGYKRKGEKTRATHMKNIDAMGRNGYAKIASSAIIKGNVTKVSRGLLVDPKCRSDFYRYKAVVSYVTDKYRGELTSGFKTGLAGCVDAWQLDHNFSIMQGFMQKVSPLVIGNKANLRMLPWKDNLQKHGNSDISLPELLTVVGYSKEESELEFGTIMKFIGDDIQNNISPNGANILERLYEANLCKKQ